ncbi:MAG: DUF1573 domain-containing protein [Bacteroidales bacterium]|nr:DUF1573 domain-containing protein [Bacteroidales bacterium]MBN2699149.1 DUF1573 domain-containing protein [Bacteroidales bacterium]
MKRFSLLCCFLLLILFSCGHSPEEQARRSGKEIYFEEEFHDFGEIAENGNGTHAFIFKNLSDRAIVINRVRSTCGCTVSLWPAEPVEPGQQEEIVVQYNTELKGNFQKSIYVYSTAANSPVRLQIKGRVIQEKTNSHAENIQ